MARELNPLGVHCAHVVIDGAVDTPWIRANFGEMVKKAPVHAIVDPAEIANAYYYLHRQKRSAWTQEMDLRPSLEKW